MFMASILDALALFGYVSIAMGIMLCIIAYFAIPKIIKSFFNGGDE